MPANHRRALRAKVSLPARLALGDEPPTACAVLDLSPEGAAVELPRGLRIPNLIRLALGPNQPLQPVRVLWRRGDLIGVRFLEVRSVPEVMPD